VHYYEGAASGRPLVLLHQSPLSARQFDAVYLPLARRGIRGIGIDLPGFGMSDPTPFVPRVEDWARAVMAAADALRLERFDVLGHHTGSLVATEVAITHPLRVRTVVINGPFPITEDERRRRFARLQTTEIDFEYKTDGSHLTKSFVNRQKLFGRDADPRRTTRMVLEQFQGAAPFWHGHHAAYQYDHAATLARLKLPALILTNTGDMIHDLALRARALRPDFDYVELAGGGVDVTDQFPEAWCDAVATFLEKHPA
jgi:pimeloyl-ACP methyl ester carboxylesterase